MFRGLRYAGDAHDNRVDTGPHTKESQKGSKEIQKERIGREDLGPRATAVLDPEKYELTRRCEDPWAPVRVDVVPLLFSQWKSKTWFKFKG